MPERRPLPDWGFDPAGARRVRAPVRRGPAERGELALPERHEGAGVEGGLPAEVRGHEASGHDGALPDRHPAPEAGPAAGVPVAAGAGQDAGLEQEAAPGAAVLPVARVPDQREPSGGVVLVEPVRQPRLEERGAS